MSTPSALARWNALPEAEAVRELLSCCACRRWAERLVAGRAYATVAELAAAADEVWWSLAPDDWLEALSAHPRIGERRGAQDARGERWSAAEQAATGDMEADVGARLAANNRRYEERFGFRFVVRASGRSATEMLALLEQRLAETDRAAELRRAAEQQRQITRLRLDELMEESR
ncbi:MAG TPA: 2-oxo-4-hydroxy-4-carboxy-5-ureidoimidazoline decarboxylase [Thermoanaerobaculia bacterium]|nr:2-oxo-4-hydroxy-4-carboxy-5-ureidoimidazoline decarboxylase [Thermoanaerobaculia bacterium]